VIEGGAGNCVSTADSWLGCGSLSKLYRITGYPNACSPPPHQILTITDGYICLAKIVLQLHSYLNQCDPAPIPPDMQLLYNAYSSYISPDSTITYDGTLLSQESGSATNMPFSLSVSSSGNVVTERRWYPTATNLRYGNT
jgi:hypothetical protein